jgi:hypothetical protein
MTLLIFWVGNRQIPHIPLARRIAYPKIVVAELILPAKMGYLVWLMASVVMRILILEVSQTPWRIAHLLHP